MTNSDELWSIQLPSGEIRKGTIDQLDEAFQSGAIAASTQVLAPGETVWTTLGALAGIEPATAHTPHHPVIAPPAQIPVSQEQLEAIPAANSLRPFTADFDDEDFAPTRKTGKKRWTVGVMAFAAVAGIAAVGVTASRRGAAAPAAAVAPPVALTAAPVYETPHPTTQAVDLANSPTAGVQLSEAQRKQIENEKAHPTLKQPGGRSSGGSAPRAVRGGKGGDPFSAKGGSKGNCQCNAGDPLCSCL